MKRLITALCFVSIFGFYLFAKDITQVPGIDSGQRNQIVTTSGGSGGIAAGDNTPFTGNNTHSGAETFTGAVTNNGTLIVSNIVVSSYGIFSGVVTNTGGITATGALNTFGDWQNGGTTNLLGSGQTIVGTNAYGDANAIFTVTKHGTKNNVGFVDPGGAFTIFIGDPFSSNYGYIQHNANALNIVESGTAGINLQSGTAGVNIGTGGSKIKAITTATASLGFPTALTIGNAETNIIILTGIVASDTLVLGMPNDAPVDSVWNVRAINLDTGLVIRTAITTVSAYTNTFRITRIGY